MKKFLLLLTLLSALIISGCSDVANDIKNGDITDPTKLAIDGVIGEYTINSYTLNGFPYEYFTGIKVYINTQNYENLIISLDNPLDMVIYSADPASLMASGLSQNGDIVTFTFAFASDTNATIVMTKTKSLVANQGVGTQGQNIIITVNNNQVASQSAKSIPVEVTHDVNKTFTLTALTAVESTPGLYLVTKVSGVANQDFPSITQDEASSTTTRALFNAVTNGNLSSAYYLFEAANTTDGAISYGFLKTDFTQAP